MKDSIWPLLVVLIVAGVAGVAYYIEHQPQEAPPPVAAAAPAAPTAPAAPEAPSHYPIEQVAPATPPAKPLAALDQSDGQAQEALNGVFSAQTVVDLFQLKGLIRRIVATIDNLPRDKVSGRVLAFNPAPGHFLVADQPGSRNISTGNYARYDAYVRAAQAVDTEKLVAVYFQFYPLFQQAYVDLGYPKGYFNDRLVQVIDNLLATPAPPLPVALAQPNSLYVYADPDLEDLSAGQKVLIRMGPQNAAVIKQKLHQIRSQVTGQGAKALKTGQRG